MSDNRVSVLQPNQVWDPQRLCFYVGLKPTSQRHRGHVVYEDRNGQRIVIVGAAA